ncbi:DDE_superfamily endonuclease domain-containing protein [Hexamita inflata]|uniref:DDE superfamily endonuclease domain-containing protein n=2 Tax=Hexamita inflata TaxID=28002 RepID=A0AA86U4E7_9EUKA|nr:DDE superfamily endonuclease domain-containing protein [Hexamita inflata]
MFWSLESLRGYAWCIEGDQRAKVVRSANASISALTAITSTGQMFAGVFIGGGINHIVFETWLRFLISELGDRQCLFWMDNCSINHDRTPEIIDFANHHIIYNAPTSPELNPIEMVFSIWKQNVKSIAIEPEEIVLQELCNKMVIAFTCMKEQQILACIDHTVNTVFAKALAKEDLLGEGYTM